MTKGKLKFETKKKRKSVKKGVVKPKYIICRCTIICSGKKLIQELFDQIFVKMRLVRNSLLNQGVKLIGFVNRQKLIQVFSKTKKNIFLILFSSTFFVRRTKK